MSRIWVFLFAALLPISAVAQTDSTSTTAPSAPYEPVVPAPSMVNSYGGWSGYSGATTAAGSAMNGMANVISAQGDYNLSTSAAAVNMTQAQKNEIQNRQQWTNTYFDMRQTNRTARAAERLPPPTMEQIARIARDGAPKPLAPNQLDPVSGRIAWPSALQEASFTPQRSELDSLFARKAHYGQLGYSDQMKAREVIDGMFDELKSQVRTIPPMDYVACRGFLQSLSYAATKNELE